MFVAGEAGIGKSRLLLEVRRRLVTAGEPATWLEGRCVSFGQSSPLLPVVEDAEAQLSGAALTIESIAARLATPRLRRSFLTAEPVARLFRALGRTPPRSE